MEYNIYQSFKNNCLGTLCLAEESVKVKLKNLFLFLLDKAVRPTNVMGLSKGYQNQLLIIINNNSIKKIGTNFSIVRFGNVLESSGSLIPC